MHQRPNLAELDKLRTRIQALRAKTIGNGCTEEEALSAAAKVGELLDRYDPVERREIEQIQHWINKDISVVPVSNKQGRQ